MTIAQASGRRSIAVEYRWVSAIAIPALVNLFVAISVFAGFTGQQATEIGKKIFEVETQLLQALPVAMGGGGLDAASQDALAKVGLFGGLLIVWCITSTAITVALFNRLLSPTWRFVAGTIVAFSVPFILIVKYVASNQRYVGETESYISIWLQNGMTSWFEDGGAAPLLIAATLVTIIIVQLALYALPRARERANVSALDFTIPVLSVCAIAIFIGVSVYMAFHAPDLPTIFGATNLLFLFVILLYPFLCGLRWLSLQLPWQATSALVAMVALINLTADHSDNTINVLDSGDAKGNRLKQSSIDCKFKNGDPWNDPFDCWFDNRVDRAEFRRQNLPYPVYIVAAAGGGAYAAIHTQLFLEYMRKHCPIFAHHIFAISGVSGGGLGALTYAGLVAREAAPTTKFREPRNRCPASLADLPAKTIPDLDAKIPNFEYIAPIIGGGLFPEMLQRVWPIHVAEFDRTRVLQRSITHQWSSAANTSNGKECAQTHFLSKNCQSDKYWTGRDDVPSLIFNATSVEYGTPVIMSHLGPWLLNRIDTYIPNSFTAQGSFGLIDAALASASFPIALPAAYVYDHYDRREDAPQGVTDGAYFENTGLPSAMLVKTTILERIAYSKGRIALSNSSPAVAQDLDARDPYYDYRQPIEVHVILLDRQDEVPLPDFEQNDQQENTEAAGSDPAAKLASASHGSSCGSGSLLTGVLAFRGSEIVAHIRSLFTARDRRSAYFRKIISSNDELKSSGFGPTKSAPWIMWRSMRNEWEIERDSDKKKRACEEPKFPIIFNYAKHTRDALQTRLREEYENETNILKIERIVHELQPACGEEGCRKSHDVSKAPQ
ncbi:MAG: hypothetical protein ACR2PA_26880 [Hyphomicrobiaceae bacterium]